jgi:phosphatidylserine decarboxylase
VSIDRSAWPFVLAAAVPAVAAAPFWPMLALALLVLPIAIALFFRDPERQPPRDPRLVLAPADGRVIAAGEARPGEAPPGAWQQVTIFLALWDVHINRTPVPGRVTRVDYVPGTFKPAFRGNAHGNEHSEIWMDVDGQTVVFRQVVGILARRVVSRISPGDRLAAGDRIGLMKFGSRMDVFVPPSAAITVRPGDHVRAGETVIARLAAGAANAAV